jgi:hypothetical protein
LIEPSEITGISIVAMTTVTVEETDFVVFMPAVVGKPE